MCAWIESCYVNTVHSMKTLLRFRRYSISPKVLFLLAHPVYHADTQIPCGALASFPSNATHATYATQCIANRQVAPVSEAKVQNLL